MTKMGFKNGEETNGRLPSPQSNDPSSVLIPSIPEGMSAVTNTKQTLVCL